MLNKIKRWFQPKAQRPYKLFQIEPTLLCSLECVMCPWTEIRSTGGSMSRETFQNIAHYLHLAESVDLTGGGEPLFNPLLPEMMLTVKQAGCSAGFSTNATKFTSDIASALQDMGQDWISFSIDAANAKSYERIRQGAKFEQVITNIAGLNELKRKKNSLTPKMMMVFVMMTGKNENYTELPELIELAHSLGVEHVIAKNLDVILKDGDDERRLFSHMEAPRSDVQEVLHAAGRRAAELGIGFRKYALQPQEQVICEHEPLHNLYFNWAGYVSPCITLSYAENRVFDGERVLVPCQIFGNINEQPLEEIWNQPAYVQFRRAYEQRLRRQQQASIDVFLGGGAATTQDLPAAPEGCRTCYYLYGI